MPIDKYLYCHMKQTVEPEFSFFSLNLFAVVQCSILPSQVES